MALGESGWSREQRGKPGNNVWASPAMMWGVGPEREDSTRPRLLLSEASYLQGVLPGLRRPF